MKNFETELNQGKKLAKLRLKKWQLVAKEEQAENFFLGSLLNKIKLS